MSFLSLIIEVLEGEGRSGTVLIKIFSAQHIFVSFGQNDAVIIFSII